jgi:hypothetical protein
MTAAAWRFWTRSFRASAFGTKLPTFDVGPTVAIGGKADEQTKALLKPHHSEIAGHAQEKLPLL